MSTAVLLALVLAAAAAGRAQAPPAAAAPPALTETQRLQLVTTLQQLEIAQLKAQLAQRDFDAAKAQLTALAQAVRVPGYDLDLQTLTYRPVARSAPGKEP